MNVSTFEESGSLTLCLPVLVGKLEDAWLNAFKLALSSRTESSHTSLNDPRFREELGASYQSLRDRWLHCPELTSRATLENDSLRPRLCFCVLSLSSASERMLQRGGVAMENRFAAEVQSSDEVTDHFLDQESVLQMEKASHAGSTAGPERLDSLKACSSMP